MRVAHVSLALTCVLTPRFAREKTDSPTDEKTQNTYKKAIEALRENRKESALEDFKRADKQDGGHCLACQRQMIKYGIELREWKTAEIAADEMLREAQGDRDTAIAHYQFAAVLLQEGLQKHKDEVFTSAHEEIIKALAASPNFPDALFLDGRALAQLRQDDAAKARFEQFVAMKPVEDPKRQRALRYISRPDLARAKMVPPFKSKRLMESTYPWTTCRARLCWIGRATVQREARGKA